MSGRKNPVERAAYEKAYKQSHREELNAYGRDWYAVNSERVCAEYREFYEAAPDEREKRQDWALRRYVSEQRTTRSTAIRHGSPWTGWELKVAGNKNLTTRDVAILIGRTFAAVMAMRKKLRARNEGTS